MIRSKPVIYLDNGPAVAGTLNEHREVIDVSSDLPRWDPRWEFVDEAGHFHARDREGFPTLTEQVEHVDCNGACGDADCCEGYNRRWYSCSICQEAIAPGKVAGPHVEKLPGPTATPKITSVPSSIRMVTVVTTELVGVGDLGRMERARER